MSKATSQFLLLAVAVGLITGLTGCCGLGRSKDLVILAQPESQTVREGSPVTFSAVAARTSNKVDRTISYQWQFNGVQLDGDKYWTNLPEAYYSTFTIGKVRLEDVGYYRVQVSGSASVASQPASLAVASATTPTTVFGLPVASGGSIPSCPGSFRGYVNYRSSPGWTVISSSQTARATDASSQSTSVWAIGLEAGDPHCALRVGSVTIPPIIHSTHYWFTVYFPSSVPVGRYGLILSNFR